MINIQNKEDLTNYDQLDQEELKTLTYLQSEKPELLVGYLSNVKAGRRGIFQRLFQAFIREKLIPDERISWINSEVSKINVNLPSGRLLQVSVSKLHSLGRFDLTGDVCVIDNSLNNDLMHPVELLELLKNEGMLGEATTEQYERFKHEIQNGVANLTLALTGATINYQELAEKAKQFSIDSSIEWALHQKKQDKEFSPLAFFEQCVVEGHPLHPGAKTKFGLSVEEVIQYSPEWGGKPEVVIIAVLKDFCRTTSIDETTVTNWLFKEYENLQSVSEEVLHNRGLQLSDFELIPVHPWQFENTLNTFYAKEIMQGKIIPISDFVIPTQSLVSFRSLAPTQKLGEKKHHIKTAINVQTTSAIRTVSPNSVVNGPILSKIFKAIQKKEYGLDGRFIVLEERAGIHFKPESINISEEEQWKLQANLASILRENPENYVLHEDEIPMAAASLISKSPISKKPIVIELIEKLAIANHLDDMNEAAKLFIRKYARTSLPGFLTMMVRYGISLEGHMQNSVTVFREGELVRILVRDFGGIRILPSRMWKQGFEAEFYPGSAIVTDEESQLHNIISYSVMQNHFAELITCIVRTLEFDEEELWEEIVNISREIFKELKKDPTIKVQAATDEKAFFQPLINLKALATMRLQGDSTSYSFMKVPNPMSTGKEYSENE
ncbi:IucA/IucC family protein [Gottfriedia acidiceleris]|uniref:IucA/IucC family protein n=1 Tax=Gottfriedia acidiceleris TaxID=371036 RepID=UPI002F26DAC3